MASDKHSAILAAEDLRLIYRADPEAFVVECQKIITQTTDQVTKQFWMDVKEFARREGRE